MPLPLLREDYCDFVVLGEGELRFPKLLKAIENSYGFEDIDGIGYKKDSIGHPPWTGDQKEGNVFGLKLAGKRIEVHDPDGCFDGKIIIRRRGLAVDLKTQYVHVVSKKTERLFIAAAKRNEVILQSSRGCNWSVTSCEFCSVGGQYTQTNPETGKTTSVYRYIPYELWSQDLMAIYNLHPFDFIELEDENSSWFIKDWRYAELLKSLGIQYHLHLRSDQLQREDIIEKLAATGCLRIHIGAESGNDETLALMRKH